MKCFCVTDSFNVYDETIFEVSDVQFKEALKIAELAVQVFEDNDLDDVNLHEVFGGVADYVAHCLTAKQIKYSILDIDKIITY